MTVSAKKCPNCNSFLEVGFFETQNIRRPVWSFLRSKIHKHKGYLCATGCGYYQIRQSDNNSPCDVLLPKYRSH